MITKEIQEKVLAAFKQEYKLHIEAIKAVLTKREGESLNPEFLEKARIHAHTLKGASKAASLPLVQTMAILMETIFSRIKKKELPLIPAVIKILETLLETIDNYIISVIDHSSTHSDNETLAIIKDIQQYLGIESEKPAIAGIKPSPTIADTKKEKILQKVFLVFQQEYKIHLENLRSLIVTMGKVKTPQEHEIDEAFRAAHTLKGAARAAEIPAVQTLAHDMETLFSKIKEEKQPFDKETKSFIETTLDAIEDYIEALHRGEATHTSKPEITQKQPNIISNEHRDPDNEMPPYNALPEDSIQKKLPDEARPPKIIDTLRIKTESLERMRKTVGRIITENQRHIQLSQHIRSMEDLLADIAEGWRFLNKTSHQHLRRMEVDTNLSKIAGYINMVYYHTQKLGKNLRSLKETQKTLDRSGKTLGQRLQKDIQRARLVPAESVFQAFRKMVRDLARDEGKLVEIQVTGLEIEADRMVFQGLKDPIMHLLRNAVSHGIEHPEERRMSGKEETGRIDFIITTKGNLLLITIEDDGKGIDLQQITQTAVKKNILTQEQASKFSPNQLQNVIFHPGFSTATDVTQLYGRGMGLSVVKETLHRLQGDIQLFSEKYKGTRLTIAVPLTIMSHLLMLVTVNDHVFGIPVTGISRLIHLETKNIETLENKPVIRYEDNLIPLFTLEYLLGMGESALSPNRTKVPVVILKANEVEFNAAIAVQEFKGEEDVIIQELPYPLSGHPCYYGGYTGIDGTVTLVLNPGALIEFIISLEKKSIPIASKKEEITLQEKKAKILIVDDSITTRTLEKTILDAHGYDVYVSVDGMEALQFLQMHDVNLVITDVAMPRMNGFQLVEEMKKNKRLKSLPVIIVSSLDRKEDREKGLALGADAYIVKQKFEQQNLLETIRQII